MREKIHTIPLNEAFLSGDECPFCHLERETEQRAIRFTLGPSASYMEPEIRNTTNRTGFCRAHYKKMFDYSNPLGSALIMQSHYGLILEELSLEIEGHQAPQKRGLLRKKADPQQDAMAQWAKERTGSCFICRQTEENMDRYYSTFFYLLREEEFCRRAEQCNSFCLPHFARLMEEAPEKLPANRREWFYKTIPAKMEENLRRVKADLDWFIAKFDYRNAGADWKNSRDAVKRAMQKLQGGYPADPPFKE